MDAPKLEVEHLAAAYGAAVVLRDVSLAVGAGELVLLAGLNGAGKTTLLRTIMGVHKHSQGEIRLRGESIATLRTDQRHKLGIAWIPEGRGVVRELSVKENLDLARFSPRWTAAARDSSLARFPILETAYKRPAAALSGGEQQMLALARALETGSDVLLIDEPSLGLAPIVVASVLSTLAALRDEGMSVLLVEQRAAEVGRIADRALALRDGRIEPMEDGGVSAGYTEFAGAR